jgi:uncharacterized protein
VMDLSEEEVAAALDQVMRRRLGGTSSGAGTRVEKYRHNLDHFFELGRPEQAALAVLMLRGPQTAGEVRSRVGRMYEFETLSEAETILAELSQRDAPLVQALPVQPGRKEPRYAHLLGGPVDMEAEGPVSVAAAGAMSVARDRGDRLDELTQRVESLEEEFAGMKVAFEEFRRQFE